MTQQQLAVKDLFAIHSYLIDQMWGTPSDVVVGKVSKDLIKDIKKEFFLMLFLKAKMKY